jgi:predicted peptidase
VAGGATSIRASFVLQRAATVSYAVYATAQDLTAEAIRAEAALGNAGPSERAGTRTFGSGKVGEVVSIQVDSLASGTNHWIYLAAEPAEADPVPTDLEANFSEAVALVPVQPAVSYISSAIAATTIGYYAYLPEDHYYEADETFPLLIFLHGSGEKGNGTTEVNRVLVHGPPKLVKNGRAFPFIIISPQLPSSQGGWPVGLVDELIARARTAYRVDPTRIYVTGLSMGGYGTWAYAQARPNVVAAVVPIAGAGNPGSACAMKNVPAWALHGDADNTVDESGSINMVNAINACSPGPAVTAKLTIYPGVGHDSWTRTYDGSAGHDIYQWLLQYHK